MMSCAVCNTMRSNMEDYLIHGLRMCVGRHFVILLACIFMCVPVNVTSPVLSGLESVSDVDAKERNDGYSEWVDTDNSRVNLIHGILINELYICDNNPFVIIFVHSAPANTKQRTAIRQSWGSVSSDPEYRALVIFVLGVTPDRATSSMIETESQSFHDILQFNIADAYKNLSLKSLALIQWTNSFCQNVKYVVKVDDDTFLNTPLLINDLHSVVHKHFLMGDLIAGARPIRDIRSKYYTPTHQFSGAMYPTYLSGAAYVMSGDVINDLTEAAKRTALFWLEDVYVTGLLARRAKAKHIFNGKFGFRLKTIAPCQLSRTIALHRISPTEMNNAWTLIKEQNVKCAQDT